MQWGSLVEQYKIKLNGVLHVGAHYAEEAGDYYRAGAQRVWWVEANPAVRNRIKRNIKRYPGQRLIEALVFEEDDVELSFNVTNYDGMSSSIYDFGTHSEFSPDIHFERTLKLKAKKIDTLVEEYNVRANFLNLDLQGAEGPALRGASNFLQTTDYVMTEVNKDEVYVGCTQVAEIDDLLSDFNRVETLWVGNQGWGDALYVRKSLLER